MLNLYSVYSALNVRRLCALLCPAISFLHFHVLQIGLSYSRPTTSCRANWSINFTSVIFTSSIFSAPVHSKLDYCNSLYYNLPSTQLHRLQQIQNSLACGVVKAPKFTHTTPILKSLHWLKINERIEYKSHL